MIVRGDSPKVGGSALMHPVDDRAGRDTATALPGRKLAVGMDGFRHHPARLPFGDGLGVAEAASGRGTCGDDYVSVASVQRMV